MVILYNKLLELFKVGMQMNDKIKENLLDQSCAPTDNLQSNWDRIDWTKAEQAVKKLQARIVKAQKEGRHNKVKALQWTLTHSFYAKALAVKRVTSNGGGCTPGVDKEIWDTPKAKMQAITQLKRRGYQPMPLRRVHIKKSNGKKDSISLFLAAPSRRVRPSRSLCIRNPHCLQQWRPQAKR
jgi:hypothetical protein